MSYTPRIISKELFLTDYGKLVPFHPTQPLELYTSTIRYYFAGQDSKLFSTLSEAAQSINRTSARASQLYNEGKIRCVKIYQEGFEIKLNERFKPLVNGYYLSNYGRILRVSQSVYTKNRYKIIQPQRTMGDHLQLSQELTQAAGLRTSLIAPTVLELFVEPRPSKDSVCIHADGNSLNNSISNLYWGTRKDAAQNRELFGKGNHGSKEKVKVKVVSDSRTNRLKPFLGRTFESISEASREIGISPMAIRQYLKTGKLIYAGERQ